MSPLRGLGVYCDSFPGADAPRLSAVAAARLKTDAVNALAEPVVTGGLANVVITLGRDAFVSRSETTTLPPLRG